MKLLNVDISRVDERTSVDRLVGFSLNWSIVWFSESIIVTVAICYVTILL